LKVPELQLRLEGWQLFDTWQRLYSSLDGQTRMYKLCLLSERCLLAKQAYNAYEPEKERYQVQDYSKESRLRNLKPYRLYSTFALDPAEYAAARSLSYSDRSNVKHRSA
jgi:hypothetical protein